MWPLCGLQVKQTTVQQKLPSSHHFGKPKSLATRMRNIDGFIQKEFVFDPLHKSSTNNILWTLGQESQNILQRQLLQIIAWQPCRLETACNFISKQYNLYSAHWNWIHNDTHHNVIQIQVHIWPSTFWWIYVILQLSYLSFTLSTALRQSCLLRSASWHLYAKCGTETKLPWDLQQGVSSYQLQTASGALLHPGPNVKINGTHQYINQAVCLGGAIPNYALEIIRNLPIGNPGGTSPPSRLVYHAFLSNCAIREIFCVSVKTFQQGLRHFTGIGGFLPRRNGGTLSISIGKGQANRKSFGTVCIIENRSIVWEGEAVFGLLPGVVRDTPEMRIWLEYCIHYFPEKKVYLLAFVDTFNRKYCIQYALNLHSAVHSPQDLSLRSKAAPVMGHRPPERRCHFSNQRRLKATGYPASWLAGMWTGSIINLMIWVGGITNKLVFAKFGDPAQAEDVPPRKWRVARARLLNFIGLILDSQGKLFWKIIGLIMLKPKTLKET